MLPALRYCCYKWRVNKRRRRQAPGSPAWHAQRGMLKGNQLRKQGPIQFGREAEKASRWPTSLSKDDQTRPVRLCSILKVAFASYLKISLMINSCMQGLDIILGTLAGDLFGSASTET